MTAAVVFLHALSVLTLGPWIAGLVRAGSGSCGWRTLIAPYLELNAGLKAPGAPSWGWLVALTGTAVAGLLIPFFSPDAVLGFLGDGFTALGLLLGFSARLLPLRPSMIVAAVASLLAIGTLTGTTDLAQGFAGWSPGLGTGLVALGLALGVAPVVSASEPAGEGLGGAMVLWARSTLQLCWLAFGTMALPWTVAVVDAGTLALALARFVGVVSALAWGLHVVQVRWPKVPLGAIGAACTILALVLAKVAV